MVDSLSIHQVPEHPSYPQPGDRAQQGQRKPRREKGSAAALPDRNSVPPEDAEGHAKVADDVGGNVDFLA